MLYKAPSKLYLAGEYAILKPKGIAIILPINKYTYLEIKKSSEEKVNSNIEDKLDLLKNAREIAFFFAKKRENFEYNYSTELYEDNVKLGLGSSASVVVVTIKAILEELNIKYTKKDLFILSTKALLKSNLKGSMGDVACIVYNKLVEYHSLDKKTFKFKLRKIKLKKGLNIEFIHTNILSDTQKKILNIDVDNKKFNIFYNKSNKYTKQYIKAIENGNEKLLEHAIRKLRENLEYFERTQNVGIYNKEILQIISQEKNCKTSGAGLGDFLVSVKIDASKKGYEIKFRS